MSLGGYMSSLNIMKHKYILEVREIRNQVTEDREVKIFPK